MTKRLYLLIISLSILQFGFSQNQIVTISGTITDNSGVPLPGVNITIVGTTQGTQSDFDGNYSINANKGQTLIFSFVGFKNESIIIEDKSILNVSLKEESSALDEVVVIGYGKQSKAKNVGAIASVDSETLDQVISSSFEDKLAGKLPGVTIDQPNAQPGSSTNIRIRGIGTLTAGANPLIVVDGYPLSEGSSLSSINPNDIANIDILKDAASAAIYGSRAANGIVMITTKQGKAGKTKITLSASMGVQNISTKLRLVGAYEMAQNYAEGRDWGYVSADPENRSASDPNSIRIQQPGIEGRQLIFPDYLPYVEGQPGLTDFSYWNEAFSHALVKDYNLSFSGGDEKTTFRTSIGYYDQDGIAIGSDYKRYSANFNLQHKLNDKIEIGFNVSPSYSVQNIEDQANYGQGILQGLMMSLPFYEGYNEDGTINQNEQLINEVKPLEGGIGADGTESNNVITMGKAVKNMNKRLRSFGNAYLDIEPLKNLNYHIMIGGDYESFTDEFFYPSNIAGYRDPAPRADADGREQKLTRTTYIVENTLNYNFELGKHSFDVLAGHSYEEERIDITNITGTSYPDNNIHNIAGASLFSVDKSLEKWALESYFGRLNYDYDKKYLFSASIRRDGSSRFGSNNRQGIFPSVSGGWILSREDFFPENNFLSFAKVLINWGKTGNNQIGNYGSFGLLTKTNYVHSGNLASGYSADTPPNNNLGWEIANSVNAGLNLGFLNNRINFDFNYFRTKRTDLLLNVPVNQHTGYDHVVANFGELENKGFEFNLLGHGLQIGDFTIGFNANLTTLKNKVLKLGPDQTRITETITNNQAQFVTEVGYPISRIWTYNILGVYKSQEEIDNSPHLAETEIGDYILEDVNNDGVLDREDRVSQGTYTPDFTYGFGANINYKDFTFSFAFNGVSGRTISNNIRGNRGDGDSFYMVTKNYWENRYHPESNPDGNLRRTKFGNSTYAQHEAKSAADAESGDYLRLKNVRLSYDVPDKFIKKIGLEKGQIYVSGSNLFTITNYTGWNVEGTDASNVLTQGYADASNYPIARTVSIGLKLTY